MIGSKTNIPPHWKHANHRILTYLRSSFPNACFEWCEKRPADLIRSNGTGRIRLYNVEAFDHADITFGKDATIRCDLLKIVPLSKAGTEQGEQADIPPNKQPIDPRIWYENNGLYLNAYDQSGDYAVEPLEVNAIAHRQIGTHLKIPAAYYDKMLEEYPELLAQNVNAWFQREPAVRMVRTIDGTARAFLSNRYRRIDNLDIAGIVLPVLQEMEGMHFESCQLTDSRMYIKVVNTRLEAEVVPGDIVQSGIIISNSEVGLGSVSIQPLVYRLVCSNGMVVNDAQTRRNHVGRVNEASENYQLYSEKTLEADDKAFAMKIQDTVRAVVDEVRFTRVVNMMREAKDAPMNTAAVPDIVKLVSKDFHITDDESSGVLQRLIEGNDLTLYGLSNAVTRHSQDVKDYDRATALEGIGYNILSMPARQWSRINQMAA